MYRSIRGSALIGLVVIAALLLSACGTSNAPGTATSAPAETSALGTPAPVGTEVLGTTAQPSGTSVLTGTAAVTATGGTSMPSGTAVMTGTAVGTPAAGGTTPCQTGTGSGTGASGAVTGTGTTTPGGSGSVTGTGTTMPGASGTMTATEGTAMPSSTGTVSGTTGSNTGSGPSITILSPANGATVAVTGMLTITVQVNNFKLDGSKIGQAPEQGVGHYHLMVDGKYAGLASTPVINLPNDAMPALCAGTHTISVELHQNDHKPVAGAQPASITINVQKDIVKDVSKAQDFKDAGVQFVYPTDGMTVTLPLVVQMSYSGFRMDGTKIGTPAVPGVGYWRLLIDGKEAGMSVTNVLQVPNDVYQDLAPGKHQLTIDVVGNDGKEMKQKIQDWITVNVTK